MNKESEPFGWRRAETKKFINFPGKMKEKTAVGCWMMFDTAVFLFYTDFLMKVDSANDLVVHCSD